MQFLINKISGKNNYHYLQCLNLWNQIMQIGYLTQKQDLLKIFEKSILINQESVLENVFSNNMVGEIFESDLLFSFTFNQILFGISEEESVNNLIIKAETYNKLNSDQ